MHAQEAYTAAIRNWEDVTLTKEEVHTLRRYLTRTISDIMARVATPSPSIESSHSHTTDEDDIDAENSGHAASSSQRDKFLSYRYLVGTISRMLENVEEQDVCFRQILAEAVSLQVCGRLLSFGSFLNLLQCPVASHPFR
jgi:hypothetical protein